MSNYIPKYLTLEELLPQEVFEELARDNQLYRGWWIFDAGILKSADIIREKYGKILCNTWVYGGNHHYRGYRPPGCRVGNKYSQHRFGRGLDLEPLDTPVDVIRDDIINKGENYLFITAVELDVSWLHIDSRNYKGLLQFRA